VRQEREEVQHNDAEDLADREGDRLELLDGRLELTMSTSMSWNCASLIWGVVSDVASGGAQIVKPGPHSCLASTSKGDGVATVVAASTAKVCECARIVNDGSKRVKNYEYYLFSKLNGCVTREIKFPNGKMIFVAQL
jgi:hypothetical protein